jgi:hypothetical protein
VWQDVIALDYRRPGSISRQLPRDVANPQARALLLSSTARSWARLREAYEATSS